MIADQTRRCHARGKVDHAWLYIYCSVSESSHVGSVCKAVYLSIARKLAIWVTADQTSGLVRRFDRVVWSLNKKKKNSFPFNSEQQYDLIYKSPVAKKQIKRDTVNIKPVIHCCVWCVWALICDNHQWGLRVSRAGWNARPSLLIIARYIYYIYVNQLLLVTSRIKRKKKELRLQTEGMRITSMLWILDMPVVYSPSLPLPLCSIIITAGKKTAAFLFLNVISTVPISQCKITTKWRKSKLLQTEILTSEVKGYLFSSCDRRDWNENENIKTLIIRRLVVYFLLSIL